MIRALWIVVFALVALNVGTGATWIAVATGSGTLRALSTGGVAMATTFGLLLSAYGAAS